MTTTDPILAEATRRLVEGFDPERIILFGSRARGTGDAHSDYDLLVIFDTADAQELRDLWLKMIGALHGVDAPIDLLLMTPRQFEIDSQIPGQTARYARADGKVLYERAA